MSNRPWDNGWAPAQSPGDVFESHPYFFCDSKYKLASIATRSGVPQGNVCLVNRSEYPVIINEYGWLWLNRDGAPTTLTAELYKNLLGTKSTAAQRLQLYARYLAAETEFWRSHRAVAAVMHFTALGYSRTDGQTSDHWLDVKRLKWEPEFYRYVRDAFAPVGVMIDAWAADYAPGKLQEFPVVVINDLEAPWKGGVRFRIMRDGKVVAEQKFSAEVASLGSSHFDFKIRIPEQAGQLSGRSHYHGHPRRTGAQLARLCSPSVKPVNPIMT